MNLKKIIFVLLIFSLKTSFAVRSHVKTFGPTININIGNNKYELSIGVEYSYWDCSHNVPYGFDIGIEYQTGKIRTYSEIQTGALIGISLGPVIQSNIKGIDFGIQSSIWGVIGGEPVVGGLNIRYRYIKNHYFCPGLLGKVWWGQGID